MLPFWVETVELVTEFHGLLIGLAGNNDSITSRLAISDDESAYGGMADTELTRVFWDSDSSHL